MSDSPVARLPKVWRPQDVEVEMYRRWEEARLFVAEPADGRPKFSILMPPPNITGELHMGHAEYTLQDLYCRYKRMNGFEVLWLPGTDHAAIATQNKIEQALAAEGTSKEQIGREAFDARVEDWYANYGARILDQLRRLGFSADWSRLRFTMDPDYVRSVRTAFVRLYEQGLIYRGPRIVNWCPRCRSSISDLEVDWQEQVDALYHVRYDLAGDSGSLVVATVRPETMLADTAVAVNPGDDRYRAMVGRHAILPLVGRHLPVVADDHVKKDFGSGALKVTPGHDPNDYEIGRRHDLEILSCIDKEGRLVAEDWVPEELRGLDVTAARKRVVELLREGGQLVNVEEYTHEVGHCDRCGSVIEPLVDEQWWCSMGDLARPAIDVVEKGRVKFVPARWTGMYLDWMYSLRDWNVSRQLWLGHRVPVYYCDNGHGSPAPDGTVSETYAFASVEEPGACPVCGSTTLRQDEDVLDTWFSSALWPFATMGWPEKSPTLDAFHPSDVLDTARDILFLWVARMIMTSLHFTGEIPFHTVLIHATVQDPQGRRMSKSLGTGVDPLDMIEKYGADAVRAWCVEVGVGRQDVRFDEQRMEAYGRFSNKLWQMARGLVLPAAEGVQLSSIEDVHSLADPVDRWIISRLDATTGTVTRAIEEYRPGDAITALYDFAWREFADWYLEAAKPRFRLEPSEPGRREAASVAMTVLDTLVRLLHPFMPFVSEAIRENLPTFTGPLIARTETASWPRLRERLDPDAEVAMEGLFEVVRAIRDARREAGLGEREKGLLSAKRVAPDMSAALLDGPHGRAHVAWLGGVEFVEAVPAGARAFVAAGLELGLAAPDRTSSPADRQGLVKQRAKAEEELGAIAARLADRAFTDKAPAHIVQNQRDRLEAAQDKLRAIEEALSRA
jgi:valyl-tRNA synthetase